MARLPRIVVPNQVLHIMHRGNNKQAIFETEEDMERIQKDIAMSLSKSKCYLHAYVIMTNHIHLLVTPEDNEQLSKFMQSMANRYVRYFNAKRQRTGTIWEGRYKSCLVDSEHYLFALYKYIEMNPVLAGMVKEPEEYQYSSYQHNALGKADPLITEHAQYNCLANNPALCCKLYKEQFFNLNIIEQEKQITDATMRGEVYGNEKFQSKIGNLISRVTKLGAHGGDRKSENYRNHVRSPHDQQKS